MTVRPIAQTPPTTLLDKEVRMARTRIPRGLARALSAATLIRHTDDEGRLLATSVEKSTEEGYGTFVSIQWVPVIRVNQVDYVDDDLYGDGARCSTTTIPLERLVAVESSAGHLYRDSIGEFKRSRR